MVEFNGYINGKAEKHFWHISRKFVFRLIVFAMIVLLPIFIYLSARYNYFELLIAFVIAFALFCLLPFIIPVTKKQKEATIPKRIYIEEDGYSGPDGIVAETNSEKTHRYISDASRVIDYGEFYHICFPFGKICNEFICQKNLLTKGTLEEFEALFEGKIERR